MKIYKLRLNELSTLAKDISENFASGVIVLKGDLAAGKTTFVKEIVKYLGIDDEVTSPTFSLQQCYGDRVFHYDMYNHGLDHFVSLGMLEELDKDGLHFVEWGNDELVEILNSAGIKTLIINIEKNSDDIRQYEVDYAYA
ncbi:MAG: tRNA (adenosine(37)-N6)-threonylcarbamoyltransferase complex ATPase subunit type 1 TsaE [Sulfurimonas sp.]|uniref:tRNA (adenosine(37)-N6)-threonylcarbamoyltransferase complex ATPase subunit type 1 TsaE n=1 Tax=Sulfurimonas sp. TaxID=2022749 RepID=UPI002635D0FA|nr:tRNA (adenosine(37)-N6)-threonylcarbamoyltransferase complex ATPase subunit type 1 TsaE [Sulfurimonas sp.]MCW8894505.1 tRNA (adenosine(37)-N6)-threonylcarbamoyltransferase complex ATPase subunit type 1 TsaE [Sulfurimonas sp.]MCW8955151.1 tRNA (adenosine(37)-N6)-threonylcarbamoyltransferase complex ATPase subunit type 1 TsaE [Sulfurimonas sp.]MCW9067766.1 tRNA (adenosine(37)-N6)-threonylcarbamoyltransferase complex ATPase subunit type 1 TsaE [Sulfurimonas sp.]